MGIKPKIAMYWASSCGGCEISLANIHDKLLDVEANFNLIFCPCLVDTKLHDIEQMSDKDIFITFFNGAIRNSDNEEMAQLLRKKSRILIAYGACSKDGGIPSLSNLYSTEEHFKNIYMDNLTVDNPFRVTPKIYTNVEEGQLTLPALYETVRSLDQVVDVDYYMPGCPPEPEQLINVLDFILSGGALPPKGSRIGVGKTTVCEECKRIKHDKKIKKFCRTWEIIPDKKTCLLEQGLICMGIATSGGCGGLCPEVNMPCIGCYGAAEGVEDQGAKMISALGSIIDIEPLKGMSEDKITEYIRNILKDIPDCAGTFYKFGMAKAMVNRRVK
ncbi:MAG: hypothetical protein PHV30_05145 [Candidatus Margulisbacteria bacterium]|nr:hypothetical protein [Candidatus Margulisiibacteriota bacterium]